MSVCDAHNSAVVSTVNWGNHSACAEFILQILSLCLENAS